MASGRIRKAPDASRSLHSPKRSSRGKTGDSDAPRGARGAFRERYRGFRGAVPPSAKAVHRNFLWIGAKGRADFRAREQWSNLQS